MESSSKNINRKLSANEARLFQSIISQKIGLYFPDNRKTQLEAGLLKCLEDNGSSSFIDYYNLLKSSSTKGSVVRNLSNHLSIRETSFFRNAPQFGVLKNHVIPEIVARKKGGNKVIRVWSAGCATGQEPYSIGITLLDSFTSPKTWDFKILASDMSSEALLEAEKGVYNQTAIRSLRKNDVEQYFEKREEGLAIRTLLKKKIQFYRHNLVTEPFSHPDMENVDIIFCRNVTIYFTIETTKKIIDHYFSKLVNGGYLFIGHSETLWKISKKFKTVEYSQTYLYRKGGEGREVADRPFVVLHPLPYQTRGNEEHPSVPISTKRPKDPETDYKAAVRAVQDKEYTRAVSIFERFDPGDVHFLEAKMGLATILGDLKKYDEAISVLDEIITEDNLHEWAYYHLGVFYSRKGDLEKACEMLNKVIYVNPKNVLATYHAAEFCMRKKDSVSAIKGYENTIHLLKSLPPDRVIPHSGDLTPQILAQSCSRQIDFLKEEQG